MNPTLVTASRSSTDPRGVVLQFDRPVDLRPPVLGACPVAAASCVWLTIAGLNATLSQPSTVGGSIVLATLQASAQTVPPGAVVAYLYGDWPVPTIYGASLEASRMYDFPARPFHTTVA
jgi:hypothetical protein